MTYAKTDMGLLISEDLEKMDGKREVVKAGFLEKMGVRKVPPSLLHVNPDDEFSQPQVGPGLSIIENYSKIARRNHALGDAVYEEPIMVAKLKQEGYLILNGHHRWAGAVKARVPTVRIKVIS